MADIRERFIFDDSQVNQAIDRIIKGVGKMREAIQDYQKEQEQAASTGEQWFQHLETTIKRVEERLGRATTQAEQLEIAAALGRIEAEKATPVWQKWTKSIVAWAASGALVAGVMKNIARESERLIELGQVMTDVYAAYGNELDRLIDRLAGVQTAEEQRTRGIFNAITRMKEYLQTARLLREELKRLENINELGAGLIFSREELETLMEARAVLNDTNSTLEDRQKALTTIYKLESQQGKAQLENLEQGRKAALLQDRQNENTAARDELLKQINAQILSNQQIDLQYQRDLAALQQENNDLLDTRLERLQQLSNLLQEQGDAIEKILRANATNDNGLAAILIEQEDILAWESQIRALLSPEQLEQFGPEIEQFVQNWYGKVFDAAQEYKDQYGEVVVPAFLPGATTDTAERVQGEGGGPDTPTPSLTTDRELLAIEAKAVNEVLTEIQSIAEAVTDAISSVYDNAIDENDRYLQSLREREAEIEASLERELEFQEQGLANNVEGRAKALADIQQLEEAAQAEQEELLKKRERAEKIANQARVVGQTAVAVSGLLANESLKGGVLGLAIAAAAIPLVFSLIQGAIANAQSIQLAEGGLIGQPGTRWSSDRTGKGHRIQGTNVVVGGDEFVMNGRTTQLQTDFLQHLNSGALDHLNLMELFNGGFEEQAGALAELAARNAREDQRDAFAHALGPLLAHWKSRPEVYAYSPGDIIVEKTGDTTKRIKT